MGSAHVLAAYWEGPRLRMVARGNEGIMELPWQGRFQWRVEGERTCVGRFSGGQHVPCPFRQPVGMWAQCHHCDPMESPQCVFEPVGQNDPGHSCSLCDQEHVVYAAWYGILPKVGLTSRARVETRLREQGADAWSIIQATPDRAQARAVERQVSFLYRIPEARTHKETLPQLTRPIDWDRIAARAADLARRLGERYDVEPGLHRIEHPVDVLPSRPHKVEVLGEHEGRTLGAKGNYLFWAPTSAAGRLAVGGAPVLAMRRMDLVGRRIVM